MTTYTYDFSAGTIPASDSAVTWAYNSSIAANSTGFAADTAGGAPGGFTNSFHGPDINDSQFWEVSVTLTVDTGGSTVSWLDEISSEGTYDVGHFYIDGVQQLAQSGSHLGTWNTRSFSLAAGVHTLKWRYDKDSSVSSGNDCYYIADLVITNVLLPGPSFHPNEADGVGQAMPAYPSTFVVVYAPDAEGVGDAFGALKVLFVAPLALGVGDGVVTPPLGDPFATPIVLSTTSGTLDVNLVGGSMETDEPDVIVGGDPSTIWLQFVAPDAGSFSITVGTASYAVTVEEYEVETGDTVATLAPEPLTGTGAPTSLDIGVVAGGDYRFRLYATTVGGGQLNTDVSWAFTVRTDTALVFQANNNVAWTPSAINVSLANATPDVDASFYIDGVIAITLTTDDSGCITNADIPVDAIAAGSHTISVVCDGQAASDTFTVLYGPLDTVTELPADSAAPTVTSTPVQYWTFVDPVGETYVFERNPQQMTPIFAPRPLTAETSTAFDGQPIVWEGARKPQEFQFQGIVTSQTELEAFDRFLNLNRRIWLVDHNKQAWAITLEQFDAEPRLALNQPWCHKYTFHAIAYFGPVQL